MNELEKIHGTANLFRTILPIIYFDNWFETRLYVSYSFFTFFFSISPVRSVSAEPFYLPITTICYCLLSDTKLPHSEYDLQRIHGHTLLGS